MKFKNIFYPALALAFVGTFTVSCADTDTAPQGDAVTSTQIEDLVAKNPAVLANTAAGMVTSQAGISNVLGSGRADDCGFPMTCLSEGGNAGDVVSPRSNYNWFTVTSSYGDRTYNYANPYIRWGIYYNQIMAVNDLIAKIDPETDNETLKGYLGLAKAQRAFDYLQLVQAYAFNVVEHADDPCVPIYLSTVEGDVYDTSRQTVATVYSQIDADLTAAETLLADYVRPSKDYINIGVVYGLRARYHLVRQEWADAATYAQKAIDAAAAEGLAPASIAAVSQVGNMFSRLAETNWMWGMAQTKEMVDGDYYITWEAQIGSLCANSYTTEVACYRGINARLWNTIADTDVRKGWWVDEDLKSPLTEGLTWNYGGDTTKEGPVGQQVGDIQTFLPYTNVKFGVAAGEALGTSETHGDFPMMRVEEMYLILAEAKGRINEGDGITILENFVKTYRDPSYSYTSSNTANFVDEVWRQRRIELWCEGFAMQDILRLKKPMVRYSQTGFATNWHEQYQFNLPAEDPYMLMVIPDDEIDGNALISDTDNNQYGARPAPNSNPSLVDGVTNMW